LASPLSPRDALDTLRRFKLVTVEAEQLEGEVRAHLEGLFPSLLVETTARLLRGWLDERATALDPLDHRFGLLAILDCTGTLEQCVAFRPGQLAKWRTLWTELRGQQLRRTSGRLGQKGESLRPATTQPAVLNRVVSGSLGGLLLLGEGGAGKSTLLNQIALSLPESRTLLAWADGLSEADVEMLADSVRFQSVLCSLAGDGEKVTVLTDSLEEAGPSLRKCWARHLSRLSGLPSVRAVLTMREADFRSDGTVRSQLQGWEELTLQLWPEGVVRDLLASAGSSEPSASLVLLLRRPLFLDLYWRTFVEGAPVAPLSQADSTTRHGLLRAFWLNRLLQSPRHQHLGDVARRCETVFAVAATQLNDFPGTGLDAEAVEALLSEGVLVRDTGLQARLRFRHPFLRDFAFSQWCLADRGAEGAYARWKSIHSGIARTGALRAMLEALADSSAENDFPDLPLTELAPVYIAGGSESWTEFIRGLAALVPDKRTNPVLWPAALQSQLGPSFGNQLLAEARYQGNTAWSWSLETWPSVASWLSDDFPVEVWRYVGFAAARSKQQPESGELRLQACTAALALRTMSEQPRFRATFGNPGRWLKQVAIGLVVPLLSDVESLAWLEREVPHFTPQTREAVLDTLLFLAPVSFKRAAGLYRAAVELRQVDGTWLIDASVWHGLLAEHALDWCLGSRGGRPGLLDQYPVEFLPLALELAEGLSVEYMAKKRKSLRKLAASFAEFPDRERLSSGDEKTYLPTDLINDNLVYTFWKTSHRIAPYEKCLELVYDCARHLAAKEADAFIRLVTPALATSRLATVRSFLLDLCLTHSDDPRFRAVLCQALLDQRIYLISDLAFWIQEGLRRGWPSLSTQQRKHVLQHLDFLTSGVDAGAPFRRLQFLAALPQEDLAPEIRAEVAAHRASSNSGFRRPAAFEIGSFRGTADSSDVGERLFGECPDKGSRDLVKRFYREYNAYRSISDNQAGQALKLPEVLEVADAVAAMLCQDSSLVNAQGLCWIWSAFESLLMACLRLEESDRLSVRPSERLLRYAAHASLAALEGVLGQAPVPEAAEAAPDAPPPWEEALRLANVVLAFDSTQSDAAIQGRFDAVLLRAGRDPHPGIQRSLFTDLAAWHWCRSPERRNPIRRLLLDHARHGDVMEWGIQAVDYFSDEERTEILHGLLQRTNIARPEPFIDTLGRWLGFWGLALSPEGQRSSVAHLMCTVLKSPEGFALLKDGKAERDLLKGVVIGMQDRVSRSLSCHSVIADFADWLGQIVRRVRRLPRSQPVDVGVLSMALHFLEKSERKNCPVEVAKPWWDAVLPVLEETIRTGDVDEVWMLLFDQHSGPSNDLSSVEEVCGLVNSLATRIEDGLPLGTLDVNRSSVDQFPRHAWRECADLAAEWLTTLLDSGQLQRDAEREVVFRLFQRLSASPLNAEKALQGLHRMQTG
jgi:hypothetical protein